MLGKRRQGHQKKKKNLTSFLMTKHYRAGFLDANEAGGESQRLGRVTSSLYKFVARDVVRLMDGDLDRSSGRGVAG